MQTRRDKIIYWTLVMIGVAAIGLALWLPEKSDMRIAIPVILVYRSGIEWLQASIIRKREIPLHKSQLAFRDSKTNWILSALVLLALIGFLFTDYHFTSLAVVVVLVNVSQFSLGNINLVRKNVPRYILTDEKLIVNDFRTVERKLEDLHSISISGLFPEVRISFVEEYDVRIRKSNYTEAELAAFIQSLLDAAPVEPDVDHNVRVLLTAATISNQS